MITFALAQQRVMRERMNIISEAVAGWFSSANLRGVLSIVLASMLALLTLGYIASTIQTIRLGIAIQEADRAVAELSGRTHELETLLQQEINRIAAGRNNFLASMEEVSNMRYLVPDSVAASYSSKMQ